MSIVIALLIAHFFLSRPWDLILVIAAVFLEAFELLLWLRWRNVRSVTGEDALMGATGRAATDLDPDGLVMVRGQLWSASSAEGIEEGEHVKVVGVEDGIKILVAPSPRS